MSKECSAFKSGKKSSWFTLPCSYVLCLTWTIFTITRSARASVLAKCKDVTFIFKIEKCLTQTRTYRRTYLDRFKAYYLSGIYMLFRMCLFLSWKCFDKTTHKKLAVELKSMTVEPFDIYKLLIDISINY